MSDQLAGGRRRFLRRGAVFGAAAAGAVTAARAEPLTVPPWTRTPGEPVLWHPYGEPSPFEKNVVRRSRSAAPLPGANSSMTPLQDLHGIITPTGLVFERHHAGIPQIDPAQHRLAVHGLVARPRIFTMDDLVRLPSVSRIHFLECSGNTGREWKAPAARSVQISHGLLSCCEWTGVPLSVVLDEVGVSPDAAWVLAEGADSAAMTRSVPLAKAMEDALLVYAQNGERLRPEHGYPLRLFLPGYEGNMSIKWLRRLKLGRAPFMSREETSKYTDSLPDGSARQFTFLMDVKSVITFPAPDHKLRERGFYEISGIAWSGHGRIRRVEVSVDGGRSWREAQLQEPVLDRALVRFRLPWRWDGGAASLESRAIDEAGNVQPTPDQLVAARGVSSTYHYNAIQRWRVAADGSIANARA
ncbi:sulfite dehydrogenase [Cupriavidus sp. TA19]|uniref:sulfite dehydrogenase n=1 Tax=unclassified Cupriavidus TaxID=2640874 RepID=UPI000E2E7022|nr:MULTISPECIES: sulfite dehydrogenase [unclassified Cupriavidus]BDB28205.1 sulfite dehydrogenase [Cupriavidus sp. P-10]GLC91642.1 sulfite dehydrogenase [Cupriavidus sp. TA19]